MASRAEKRAVAALVMCECCRDSMSVGASKSLAALLGRLGKALDEAFAQWQVVDQKDIPAIHQAIVAFDKQTFSGKEIPAPVHTSVMLGLMDALKRLAKNERANAAAAVERALRAVHRHYDRKLDRIGDYEQAAKFLGGWDEVLAGEGY